MKMSLPRVSRFLPKERGFTLIELTISMALSLTVLASTMALMSNQSKVYSNQEQLSEVAQSVRSSVNFIARRVRMMGYDSTDSKLFGLTDVSFQNSGVDITSNSALYFTCDAGNSSSVGADDGVVGNFVGERYAFYINNDNELMLGGIDPLTGDLDTANSVVLSENVVSLSFEYVYSNGTTSAGPDGVLGNADDNLPKDAGDTDFSNNLSEVRRVIITIVGRTAVGDDSNITPSNPGGFRYSTYTTSIAPKNMASVF